MKAQELRVGNWVNCLGSDVKVNAISIDTENENLYYIKTSKYGIKTNPSFNPIPLTEEILLKCGFVKKEGYYYYLNTKFILDDKFTLLDIDIFVRIQYLHQLQNLIYSLTNHELEIKL